MSLLMFRGPNLIKDAIDDLGCVRISSTASTYSSTQQTINTGLINEWYDRNPVSAVDSILVVPWGYIALNGTIGWNSGVVVPGYNGGLPIRVLPNGAAIVCGASDAIGRYGALYSWNNRTAGFVMIGNNDQPVIRLGGNGNYFAGNLYGYQYLSGDTVPVITRGRAGIEFYQLPSHTQNGHHIIRGTFTGFDKGIRIEPSDNHCDHTDFENIAFRDCLTGIYCNQMQAKNHYFGLVHWYCPNGVQSTVFDYQNGGEMTCAHCALTGDYGVTLLRTNLCDHNNGHYDINFIVDRAILTATQAGNGYFRAHEHQSSNPFSVHLRGHINFAGASLATPNWQNQGGQATVSHVAPGAVRRYMTMRVAGLDDTNSATYKDYRYPPL